MTNLFILRDVRYARENFKRLGINLKQPLKVGYFYVVDLEQNLRFSLNCLKPKDKSDQIENYKEFSGKSDKPQSEFYFAIKH